tara:strand:- start:30 stop:218 length:189 start_codon:yes stop_codon:yes gene_type:complete
MLSEVINMIEMKVTPEMIRHIIKEKDRLITTEQAEMFLNLFGQQIEDAVRETIKQEVRKHYE